MVDDGGGDGLWRWLNVDTVYNRGIDTRRVITCCCSCCCCCCCLGIGTRRVVLPGSSRGSTMVLTAIASVVVVVVVVVTMVVTMTLMMMMTVTMTMTMKIIQKTTHNRQMTLTNQSHPHPHQLTTHPRSSSWCEGTEQRCTTCVRQRRNHIPPPSVHPRT